MELSKPYKGKGKRKIKKMPFTVKGYILYYAFFWVLIISIYLAFPYLCLCIRIDGVIYLATGHFPKL